MLGVRCWLFDVRPVSWRGQGFSIVSSNTARLHDRACGAWHIWAVGFFGIVSSIAFRQSALVLVDIADIMVCFRADTAMLLWNVCVFGFIAFRVRLV